MRTVNAILAAAVVMLALGFAACSSNSAVVESKSWTVLETREMTYEQAWSTVRNTLIEYGFSFDAVDKNNGFMRTQWRVPQDLESDYPDRIIVKFTSERSCSVRLYPECKECGMPYQEIPRLRQVIEEISIRLH
ncbi:MAG: hypothetical protein QHI48_04060 [Bacteroidota bacterium]|nr:hypothetical protein [Bacteroidota bacterium]